MPADALSGRVPDHLAGQRLDAFLSETTELSRSRAAQLIRDGEVRVDGDVETKPSRKVIAGADVVVSLPEPTPIDAQPEQIALSVVYEDHDVIVIDKPPGLVVHPAPGHPDGTLVNALLHHCDDLSGIGGEMRPGIVHRIDKDTSGLLVATKNDEAHRHLQAQFAAHTIDRAYEAICVRTQGPGLEDAGTFETRHGRHPTDRKKFTGRDGGPRHAITHYEVLERLDHGMMHVRCTLETGRTHQIRMHLAEAGCPILGDTLYGGRSVGGTRLVRRHALHARLLGFDHPNGEHVRFESPLPGDLTTALVKVRRGATWRT